MSELNDLTKINTSLYVLELNETRAVAVSVGNVQLLSFSAISIIFLPCHVSA